MDPGWAKISIRVTLTRAIVLCFCRLRYSSRTSGQMALKRFGQIEHNRFVVSARVARCFIRARGQRRVEKLGTQRNGILRNDRPAKLVSSRRNEISIPRFFRAVAARAQVLRTLLHAKVTVASQLLAKVCLRCFRSGSKSARGFRKFGSTRFGPGQPELGAAEPSLMLLSTGLRREQIREACGWQT